MIRQIRYFQSVVLNHSFSIAAEECHISQSAISQQIQALERELGFLLLERKNRKFELTPAGEYFYKKSLILTADYERICLEAEKIAHEDEMVLRIGYLRCYSGQEFHCALERFVAEYPEVSVQVIYGNHEELFHLLCTGGIDLAFNDQRRAFSEEYVNLLLTAGSSYIEISARNSIAGLALVTLQDLKNIPCILVTSQEQQKTEEGYYRDVVGFQGGFLFSKTLEEARLSVIGGKGFLLADGGKKNANIGGSISRVPLFRGKTQISRNYCVFWKKDNSGYYIEEFADMLKKQFQ